MTLELVLPWIVGAVGSPLITWFKGALKLEGKAAMWLTLGVSVALALVSMLVTQELTVADFDPASIFATFAEVLAAATIVYKLLHK